MVDVKSVSVGNFKDALKSLNVFLEENEMEKVKVVTRSNQNKLDDFIATIEKFIEDDRAGELPEDVIEFYNEECVGDDDEETEQEETEPEELDKEEVEKPKKGKKKKEKKEKKEKKAKKTVDRDKYGCSVNSGAAKINKLLEEGTTLENIIEKVGTTKSRVSSHFNSLKKKGWFIVYEEGVYTITDVEPEPKPKPEKKKKEKKEKTSKKGKKGKKGKKAKKTSSEEQEDSQENDSQETEEATEE